MLELLSARGARLHEDLAFLRGSWSVHSSGHRLEDGIPDFSVDFVVDAFAQPRDHAVRSRGIRAFEDLRSPLDECLLGDGRAVVRKRRPIARKGGNGGKGRKGRAVRREGRPGCREGGAIRRQGRPGRRIADDGGCPGFAGGALLVPPLSPPNGLSPLESLSSLHAERDSARAGTARQTANFLRSIRDPLSSARLVRGSGQLKDLAFGTERPTRELSGVEGLGPWGRLPFFRLWARWVSVPGRPGVFGDFTGRALAHRLAVHIGLSRPFDPHMDTRGWRSDSLWAIVGP